MPYAFFNQNLVPESDVCLPADAGAVLFGHGLFASLICLRGRPWALERHYAKFSQNADRMGLQPPDFATVSVAIDQVLEKNGQQSGEVRCRVWLGANVAGAAPLFLVTTGPVPAHDPLASTSIIPWRRNAAGALTGIKSISYAENILARQWAAENDLTEAVFLNTSDELCEGTTSNLFWVTPEGTLQTPAEATGCLPGVTREIVLEIATELEIPVEIGHFPANALDTATEAFFTSTYRKIQPIRTLGHRTLPLENPVTQQVLAAWRLLEEKA